MFFIEVPEGTAKIVLKPGGKFSRVLMNWKKYFIAEESNSDESVSEGDIVKKDGDIEKKIKKKRLNPILGTGYFLKIPFWESIYSYSFEWSDNHYRGKKEKNNEIDKIEEEQERKYGKKEKFDYINLKEQYFRSHIEKTTGVHQRQKKTKKEGNSSNQEVSFNRVDVKVEYMVTLRIINPYEFIFDSPENSYDAVLERLDNLMGDIISQSEFNLVERLQGSRDALWYGLRNPKHINYKEEYSNISENDLEKLKKKHKEIWANYERDITNSEDVKTVFKGLKDQKLISETFPGWGIKIISEGVEIVTVEPPAEIKENRKKLAKKDIEFELAQRDREITEVNAKANEIKGEGKRKEYAAQMSSIDDLIDKLIKRGLSPSKANETAEKAIQSLIAGDKGILEKRIFEGLEGGIAGLATQWEMGKNILNDKEVKKNSSREKKENDNSKEKEGTTFVDDDGKDLFTF